MTSFNNRLASSLLTFVLFVLFYLYFFFYVDLRFIYSCGGMVTNFPVFAKNWSFFRDSVLHPGGGIEYLSACLSHLFYIGWAGALVVTCQAGAMCACVGYILKTVNLSFLRCLRFVPVLILLITYTQYTYYFHTTMAFLTALAGVCLYLRITAYRMSDYGRLAILLILSIMLYFMAGGASLLFGLLCMHYELLFKRHRLLGLACLFLAVAIPYGVGVRLFGGSVIDAFSNSLPLSWKILSFKSRRELIVAIYILYTFLPLTMLCSWLCPKTLSSKIQTLCAWLKRRKASPDSPALRSLFGSLGVLAMAVATVVLSMDGPKRTLFAVHYHASHRQWSQVLQAARRHPSDPLVMNAVSRALYHTGRLGDDLFCWPQQADALFSTGEDHNLWCWQKFDTQIDLGLMNMAERNLTECTQVFGDHPMFLKRLALINMVKARYGSARIYLGALSQTLFHSAWANDYIALLQSDPNLSTDERIQHLRSLCPEKDYATIGYSKERVLCDLLEKNVKNRMAFEYLTAWYMLTKQLGKCVKNIEHINEVGYLELPRLYEEVVMIYVYSTRKPVQLADHPPSPDARTRIETFSRIFNSHGRNKAKAFEDLQKDYSDSYFLYHIYGNAGVRK